jgi:Flp pilus assembly protein TadG
VARGHGNSAMLRALDRSRRPRLGWRIRRLPRIAQESGQMFALTVVVMPAMLAMTAFVLDVGSWFRAHRHMQAVADAAALAGAQALPEDPSRAVALALEYAHKNGGGVGNGDITISSQNLANDTITVRAHEDEPAFFAKVVGLSSVNVKATAASRASSPSQVRHAAPFAVDIRHELISGSGCPCYQQDTTLYLQQSGPGAFRIVNIDGSSGPKSGSTVADWTVNGYNGDMPLGWYYSDPGSKFNSNEVRTALDQSIGSELLLPLYDAVQGQGSGFNYEVVGWVGFYLTGYDMGGSGGARLYGRFTTMIVNGLPSNSSAFYGAKVVRLVA